MTAQELMEKHNRTTNIVTVGLPVCEYFLNEYFEFLLDKTEPEILNFFENYVWLTCFG